MKIGLSAAVEGLFRLMPARSVLLERCCRNYIDRFHGNNNCDLRKNGEYRFVREVLPSCRTVFDIGANVGDWTLLALDIHPGLDIHCFEPSAATFQRLRAMTAGKPVVLNPFGLGSSTGESELYVFDEGSGLNSLYRRKGLEDGWAIASPERKETVRLTTIDSYCGERNIGSIDFVKLDVEGHELEALKGASEAIRSGRIHFIQFEYGSTYIDSRILLKDLFDFFEPFDYQLHKIHPDALKPVDRYDQRLENFQYQNWVAVRR